MTDNENPRGLPVVDISSVMKRSFALGQAYWAEADSESYAANRRSDITRAKFDDLLRETATDYAALLAEVEALRADAARYRWLRHGDNDEAIIRGPVKDGAYLLRNGNLDAAIDAAMAAEGRDV